MTDLGLYANVFFDIVLFLIKMCKYLKYTS